MQTCPRHILVQLKGATKDICRESIYLKIDLMIWSNTLKLLDLVLGGCQFAKSKYVEPSGG